MLFKPAGDVSSLVVGLCVEDALTGELWEREEGINDSLACAHGTSKACSFRNSSCPPQPDLTWTQACTLLPHRNNRRTTQEATTIKCRHTCTHKHAYTEGYTTVQIHPAAMVTGAAEFGSRKHSKYNFVMHSIITELWTKCESWHSCPCLYHRNCSCTNTHMTPW